MKGWLYVISNAAVKGMVRVGATPKDPVSYAESLDKAGLPFPYEVGYEALVPDMEEAENVVSIALSSRIAGKGWYSCSVADAVREIVSAAQGKILIENRYDYQSRADKMREDVSGPDPARRAEILSDPSCPLNILRFAVEREEEDSVLLAMLANRACLGLHDSLIDLVERLLDREAVLMAIAKNPNMPASVLEAVFASKGDDIDAKPIDLALIRNPNFPAAGFANFTEYYADDEKIVDALLARADCGMETLANFVYYNPENETLKESTKKHPNWSSELFLAFLERESVEDALWVAEHPDCPPSLLERLWESGDHYVRKAVLSHHVCPTYILFDASFISNTATLEDLARNDLADTAMSNPSNPLVLAADESATEEQLRDLVSIGGQQILLRLARNEASPTDLLDVLATSGSKEMQFAVLENHSCPVEVLTRLSDSDNEEVREAIAAVPKCPYNALAVLANDGSDTVREIVALRDDCPSELLRKLAYDEVPKVGSAAIRNPNCPQEILEEFAASEFYEWKLAVLENRKCPEAIVEYLALDVKHEVRTVAKRRMSAPRGEPKQKPRQEETLESVRERFRNYARKTLGAVIEESELLRLSSLSTAEKEEFAAKFPSQAKQLALFEKYLFPKIREASSGSGG